MAYGGANRRWHWSDEFVERCNGRVRGARSVAVICWRSDPAPIFTPRKRQQRLKSARPACHSAVTSLTMAQGIAFERLSVERIQSDLSLLFCLQAATTEQLLGSYTPCTGSVRKQPTGDSNKRHNPRQTKATLLRSPPRGNHPYPDALKGTTATDYCF